MPIPFKAPRIYSVESPRNILLADFKPIKELPIGGGWGYDKDDAVIELFNHVLDVTEQQDLLSSEHFSVDGTLIQGWTQEFRVQESQ